MNSNNLKYLTFALSLTFSLLVITPLVSAYAIASKDNLDDDLKGYYINCSFDYFDDYEKDNQISIERLIKKGYAQRNEKLSTENCNISNSIITKNDNVYSIDIICKEYTSSLKVIRTDK
jgi:hypothetical protein